MPNETVAQITFRGQVLDAKLFWCGGQQFLMASVPGTSTAPQHSSEQKEFVVLDSSKGDRLNDSITATIKSIQSQFLC